MKEFSSSTEKINRNRDKATRTQGLLECAELCEVELPKVTSDDASASKLLIGVNDANNMLQEGKFDGLITLPDGSSVGYSLNKLLSIKDPNCEVYNKGRNLFSRILKSSDLLANTPLEMAYVWVIACSSALTGTVCFANEFYDFQCHQIKAGRIFPGSIDCEYDISHIERNTLYYVQEREGFPTHPLADLFFISEDNELVLVDIAGGNEINVTKKEERLEAWIAKEQSNKGNKTVMKYTLKGVILAPNVKMESKVQKKENRSFSNVRVVRGEDALALLGGLRQMSRWLQTGEKD